MLCHLDQIQGTVRAFIQDINDGKEVTHDYADTLIALDTTAPPTVGTQAYTAPNLLPHGRGRA